MRSEFENPIDELRKDVAGLYRPLSMIDTQLSLLREEAVRTNGFLWNLNRSGIGSVAVIILAVLLVILAVLSLILWRVW